jgi:hypothetical protein
LVEPSKDPIEQTINNSDHASAAAIKPLPATTNRLLGTSFAHPERALRVGIMRSGEGEGAVGHLGPWRSLEAEDSPVQGRAGEKVHCLLHVGALPGRTHGRRRLPDPWAYRLRAPDASALGR